MRGKGEKGGGHARMGRDRAPRARGPGLGRTGLGRAVGQKPMTRTTTDRNPIAKRNPK
jgi:hypothetical protein